MTAVRVVWIMILLLAITLFDQGANAEPSRSIRYLSKEPVNMLDWGLYRLNTDLRYFFAHNMKSITYVVPSVSVDYLQEENRIRIGLHLYSKQKNLQKKTAKGICDQLTKRARVFFAVDENKTIRKKTGVAFRFNRSGFEMKNRPKNLMDEIESLIEIHAKVSVRVDESTWKKIAESKSPLMGKEVLYIE